MSLNPKATTWKFTIRINDTVDPSAVMDIPHTLEGCHRIQAVFWHLEKWSTVTNPFVRGIVRCTKPTSLKMMSEYMPDANFKRFMGTFALERLDSLLKPLYRIGDICKIGSVLKRPFTGACPTCGVKRVKLEPLPSPPSSDSESEDLVSLCTQIDQIKQDL